MTAGGPTHELAIVHDYLTQRGGAERVVLAMLDAFPGAPVYTSLYEPAGTFPEFEAHDVRTLWTDRLAPLRRDHRRGLPLYPLAFSSTTVDAEVTICSSSGFAHGARTTGRKVVYCHTPARWLYDEAPTYLDGWPTPVRAGLITMSPALRKWDGKAARSADAVLANSTAVQARIARHYGIHAEVLPPPVSVATAGDQRPLTDVEPGFLLSVGRLLAYKNVAAVVEAMAHLPNERLVVAGAGPERARLEAAAPPNVVFAGEVADAELRWLYANCAGLVSASFEDYGLTPIEAAAYGKPSAVLQRGGFLDTVIDGRTGLFFAEPEPRAISHAIGQLLAHEWDPRALVDHAAGFSPEAFADGLRQSVRRTLNERSGVTR